MDELTADEADRRGLPRVEAVIVATPGEVRARDDQALLVVEVGLPRRHPAEAINLDVEGSCMIPTEAADVQIAISPGVNQVSWMRQVSLPDGETECFVQVGASFAGLPSTGDSATVSITS